MTPIDTPVIRCEPAPVWSGNYVVAGDDPRLLSRALALAAPSVALARPRPARSGSGALRVGGPPAAAGRTPGGQPVSLRSRAIAPVARPRPGADELVSGDEGGPATAGFVPKRMTSYGTGLVLDWLIDLERQDQPYLVTVNKLARPRHEQHHPTVLDAYVPAGIGELARWSALWMCDDDNSYASYALATVTVEDVDQGAWLEEGFRPLSIVPYAQVEALRRRQRVKIGAEDATPIEIEIEVTTWRATVHFAASAMADDWGRPGAMVQDTRYTALVPAHELVDHIEQHRLEGLRPISIRGVGVPVVHADEDGVQITDMEPKLSVVYVRDGVSDEDWLAIVQMPAAFFDPAHGQAWAAGFRTISLTGYNSHGQLMFAAVMVRDTSGADGGVSEGWTYQRGMTSGVFEIECINRRSKGEQLVCFTSYPGEGDGWPGLSQGAADVRLYAAVWRRYAPRRLAVSHDAYARDEDALSRFGEILPTHMQKYNVSAASVAISKDGELVFSAGYSFAPEGYPEVTRASPFRLASVSKSITSLGIFALIQDGAQVELKDGSVVPLGLDVNAFDIVGMPTLPDVVAAVAPLSTIGRLLSHRSGWRGEAHPALGPDTVDLGAGSAHDRAIAQALGVPLPLVDLQVQWFMGHPEVWEDPESPFKAIGLADAAPVEDFNHKFQYSNANYLFLQWVTELASHQGYGDFIWTRILEPLGANLALIGSERIAALAGEPVYPATKVSYRNDAPFEDVDLSVEVAPSVVGRGKLGVFAHPWQSVGPYIRNRERTQGAGSWAGTPDACLVLMESFLGWSRSSGHGGMVAADGRELLSAATMDAIWADDPIAQLSDDIPAGPGASYLRGWYSIPHAPRVEELVAQGDAEGEAASLARTDKGWCLALTLTSLTQLDGLREAFVDAMLE
ncbi:MAG: serine hydrolase [Nannocystaceae bacterium]|nr:serine hydrolase [Nannocystaceae bacterium]